jgi:hypothetical protein
MQLNPDQLNDVLHKLILSLRETVEKADGVTSASVSPVLNVLALILLEAGHESVDEDVRPEFREYLKAEIDSWSAGRTEQLH